MSKRIPVNSSAIFVNNTEGKEEIHLGFSNFNPAIPFAYPMPLSRFQVFAEMRDSEDESSRDSALHIDTKDIEDFAKEHPPEFLNDILEVRFREVDLVENGRTTKRLILASDIVEEGPFGSSAFQVVQTGEDEIKVRYGTVNSIAPPQVNPDIEQATAFAGFPTELWLLISLDEFLSVESVNIQSSEPGADTERTAKLRLANIFWNTSGEEPVAVVSQNVSGSLWHSSCGAIHYFGRV